MLSAEHVGPGSKDVAINSVLPAAIQRNSNPPGLAAEGCTVPAAARIARLNPSRHSCCSGSSRSSSKSPICAGTTCAACSQPSMMGGCTVAGTAEAGAGVAVAACAGGCVAAAAGAAATAVICAAAGASAQPPAIAATPKTRARCPCISSSPNGAYTARRNLFSRCVSMVFKLDAALAQPAAQARLQNWKRAGKTTPQQLRHATNAAFVVESIKSLISNRRPIFSPPWVSAKLIRSLPAIYSVLIWNPPCSGCLVAE